MRNLTMIIVALLSMTINAQKPRLGSSLFKVKMYLSSISDPGNTRMYEHNNDEYQAISIRPTEVGVDDTGEAYSFKDNVLFKVREWKSFDYSNVNDAMKYFQLLKMSNNGIFDLIEEGETRMVYRSSYDPTIYIYLSISAPYNERGVWTIEESMRKNKR